MKGIDKLSKVIDLYFQIDEILNRDWDPICVNEYPNIYDEYDYYSMKLFLAFYLKKSDKEILSMLDRFIIDEFELDNDRSINELVLETIKKLNIDKEIQKLNNDNEIEKNLFDLEYKDIKEILEKEIYYFYKYYNYKPYIISLKYVKCIKSKLNDKLIYKNVEKEQEKDISKFKRIKIKFIKAICWVFKC